MSDPIETTPTDPQTPQPQPDAEQPQSPESGESQPDAGSEKSGIDTLPSWAQQELRTARDDAASYRKRLREAEEKLGKAKSPEEFDAARAELAEENRRLAHSLAQRDAAATAGLPAELAARLEGSSPEELAADAQRLLALFGNQAAPPPRSGPGGGGLNPVEQPLGDLDGTPREIADRMRKLHGVR